MQRNVLLLFLLLGPLCSGFAQEFEVRSFEADPTDLAARRYEKRTVNDEPAALIKVLTNIEGMLFDTNIGTVDVEHKDEGYWVYVAPRERRIRLMADGFLPLDVSLPEPARASTVYNLVVTSTALSETLNVIPVNFIVDGHEDAVLTIGDEALPINQTVSLPRGENNISIFKPGYHTIDTVIEVSEAKTLFRFELDGIVEERVTIRSNPEGADIYINNVRQNGRTPFQFFLFPDEYSLRLSRNQYKDLTTTIHVLENEDTEFVFELERYAGTLSLAIDPEDATILINQRDYSGQEEIALSQGTYRIVAEKEGFETYEDRFQIQEGEVTNIAIKLTQKTGSLRVTSISPAANFILKNSQGEEIMQWQGSMQVRELPVGRYTYLGNLDGYDELSGEINVTENEATRVDAFFSEEHHLGGIPEQYYLPDRDNRSLQSEKEAYHLFSQQKYSYLHLTYTTLSLDTYSFSQNFDRSLGANLGYNYSGSFWGLNLGAGYNLLTFSEDIRGEMPSNGIEVVNFYGSIGPTLRVDVFELFAMAGVEGAYISYDDLFYYNYDNDKVVGDVMVHYGAIILPRDWRIGFRYSGNYILGLLAGEPPFLRQEFGIVFRI